MKRKRVPPNMAAQVLLTFGSDCWLDMPGCTHRGTETMDHVKPYSLYGPTVPSNLRPACKHCNSLRADRVVSGFGAQVTAVIGPPCVGKTAYVRGSKVTGTMPNRGKATGTIATVAGKYTIQNGYHDGSGTVQIDSAEQAKIIAKNIREGITILGVKGSMSSSEGMKPQAKSVTPTAAAQTVLPDEGYNCLSQVTVAAIPYSESENSAGGLTVTIG